MQNTCFSAWLCSGRTLSSFLWVEFHWEQWEFCTDVSLCWKGFVLWTNLLYEHLFINKYQLFVHKLLDVRDKRLILGEKTVTCSAFAGWAITCILQDEERPCKSVGQGEMPSVFSVYNNTIPKWTISGGCFLHLKLTSRGIHYSISNAWR